MAYGNLEYGYEGFTNADADDGICPGCGMSGTIEEVIVEFDDAGKPLYDDVCRECKEVV